MFSKRPLFCCFIVTLPARVLYFFMYCSFVLSKISFGCCLIAAFAALLFDSFMYPFRNYIKIGRWSDIRCFLLKWKSIWFFPLRLEGCLLSDHLPPNKPNFHLISDHLPNIWYQTGRLSEYFKISYIRLEEFHIQKYLISDWKVIWIF